MLELKRQEAGGDAGALPSGPLGQRKAARKQARFSKETKPHYEQRNGDAEGPAQSQEARNGNESETARLARHTRHLGGGRRHELTQQPIAAKSYGQGDDEIWHVRGLS